MTVGETENGSLVILNNGIEFAVTYFIMLLALLFIGAGRYLSVDFWLARRFAGAAPERSVGVSFGGQRAAATTRMSSAPAPSGDRHRRARRRRRR